MGRERTEQCESDGDGASALGSSELRLVLRGAPHWAEVSRPSNSLCLVIGWGMSRKKAWPYLKCCSESPELCSWRLSAHSPRSQMARRLLKGDPSDAASRLPLDLGISSYGVRTIFVGECSPVRVNYN